MRVFLTMEGNQAVDHYGIVECGIPGEQLMARAGAGVVQVCEETGFLGDQELGRILCLAGKGNNGGDAFVVARLLQEKGYPLQVLSIADQDELQGDALHHHDLAVSNKVDIHYLSQEAEIEPFFESVTLIFDGLLGTGISGELRAPYDHLINTCNDCGAIAIDVPSGVTGDTGKVLSPCINASLTVSMGFGKIGTLFEPAKQHAGQVAIVDIGFPEDSLDHIDHSPAYEIFPGDFGLDLLSRAPDVHKYQAGKVLVIAGSTGFSGAAVLTAQAAMRSGAGLVRLAVPSSLGPIAESLTREVVVEYCAETSAGSLAEKAFDHLSEMADWADVVALGPGIGRDMETQDLCRQLVTSINCPLIIDADALFALSADPDLLIQRVAGTIITPHAGEFKRLVPENQAEANWKIARTFALYSGSHVLLKGAPSILATPGGDLYVNSTGHAGLATAGSGDVLTGVLAGLWSQSDVLPDILVLGMVKHCEAADVLREEKGILGLIAGDLIEALPEVLKEFGT